MGFEADGWKGKLNVARRKTAKQAEIKPWLSARQDCKEGRFIQVGNSLLLSDEFQKLSATAQILYLSLAMESGGRKETILSRANAKKYGISAATYSRSIKQLSAAGFIQIDETRGRYESNKFTFSTEWKHKNPVSK